MTSIRKRTWLGSNGESRASWQVDYRDQAGRRRSKQFKRKKEAEAWLVNAIGEVRQGIHTPDSTSITVLQAAERWLNSVRAAEREPTTIASYEQHVRLHIVPKCGLMKLSQLSTPIVKGYLDDWLLTISRPMALRVLRSLKALIAEAQASGLVAQNVAQVVKAPRQARDSGKVRPPTKEALRRILKAARTGENRQAEALVAVALFGGLRASELRGLPWDAVCMTSGRVTVRQRADALGTIGPPKSTAGYRTIPLPFGALEALRKWKVDCPSHYLDLVFPSVKGKPLSHRVMLSNIVMPIMRAADVEPFGMHTFRHAAASLWIDRGINPKRVQYLMGHSSIQVTFDTYGHLFDQAGRDAEEATAIERALFGDAT